MRNELIPVVIEVTPLAKRPIAEDIQNYLRMTEGEYGKTLDISATRRDKALGACGVSGRVDTYGPVEMTLDHSVARDIGEYHEKQALSVLDWVLPYSMQEGFDIKGVVRASIDPASFSIASLRWRLYDSGQRILPDHKLASDNDIEGELGVCLSDGDHTRWDDPGYLGRVILFNGLGGNDVISPPAVAGVYNLKRAENS